MRRAAVVFFTTLVLTAAVDVPQALACSVVAGLSHIHPADGAVVGPDVIVTVFVVGRKDEDVVLKRNLGGPVPLERLADMPSNYSGREIHLYRATQPLLPGRYVLKATLDGEVKKSTFRVVANSPDPLQLDSLSAEVEEGAGTSCDEGFYRWDLDVTIVGSRRDDIAYFCFDFRSAGGRSLRRGGTSISWSNNPLELHEYVPEEFDCVDVTPIAQDGQPGIASRACREGVTDGLGDIPPHEAPFGDEESYPDGGCGVARTMPGELAFIGFLVVAMGKPRRVRTARRRY